MLSATNSNIERVTHRVTLRQLPLAVRLVLTCFLFSVGLGYFSALVQLHMQHSNRDGEPLPTPADVIERFSGVKKADPNMPIGPQPSKIESLISGETDSKVSWGKTNMTPAFFDKSGSSYTKDCADRGKAVVDAEREGERTAMIAWIKSEQRSKSYEDDAFPFEAKSITEEFYDKEKKAVSIKTLIESRCGKCHSGDKKPELSDYAKLEPFIARPTNEVLPGGWVRSSKQIGIEGLTQSTHAHLLSFAMLFSLTGLVFAFSSYPGWIRVILGPIVVVAQVADVSCWWLARIPNVGPMFAQAILLTGGTVGLGLVLQIILSVFNMYGKAGKAFLLALLIGAGLGFGVLYQNVLGPALAAEKQAAKK
jgi:hypothetical protein